MFSYVDYSRSGDEYVITCPEHGKVGRLVIGDREDVTAISADLLAEQHDSEFHSLALPRLGEPDTDGGTVLALDVAELTAVRDALRYATLRRPDLRAGIPPVLLP